MITFAKATHNDVCNACGHSVMAELVLMRVQRRLDAAGSVLCFCQNCISDLRFADPHIPFNIYTNEKENLGILSEEAAEVIQMKEKILRFGIDDVYQERGKSNREAFAEEIGHLIFMVQILVERGILSSRAIEKGRRAKVGRLAEWYNFIASNLPKDREEIKRESKR